jgi:hypothetical protein
MDAFDQIGLREVIDGASFDIGAVQELHRFRSHLLPIFGRTVPKGTTWPHAARKDRSWLFIVWALAPQSSPSPGCGDHLLAIQGEHWEPRLPVNRSLCSAPQE